MSIHAYLMYFQAFLDGLEGDNYLSDRARFSVTGSYLHAVHSRATCQKTLKTGPMWPPPFSNTVTLATEEHEGPKLYESPILFNLKYLEAILARIGFPSSEPPVSSPLGSLSPNVRSNKHAMPCHCPVARPRHPSLIVAGCDTTQCCAHITCNQSSGNNRRPCIRAPPLCRHPCANRVRWRRLRMGCIGTVAGCGCGLLCCHAT
jgi:hypothetical protein